MKFVQVYNRNITVAYQHSHSAIAILVSIKISLFISFGRFLYMILCHMSRKCNIIISQLAET